MIDIQSIPKSELEELATLTLVINADVYDDPVAFWGEIKRSVEMADFTLCSIIAAINAGFHIILYGPPGTAKSTLSYQIPELAYGARVDLHTADSDWSVKRVIGGRDVRYRRTGDSDNQFQELILPVDGYLTQGILSSYREMYLDAEFTTTFSVIDEFNRTDMDACLGPLFTAMGSQRKVLRLPHNEGFNENMEEILIPDRFRMICSMNKYDRTFTTELSEALTRRFKWIHVGIPDDRDRELQLVMERIRGEQPFNQASVPQEDKRMIDVPQYVSIRHFEDEVIPLITSVVNELRALLPVGTSYIIDSLSVGYHYYLVKRALLPVQAITTGIYEEHDVDLERIKAGVHEIDFSLSDITATTIDRQKAMNLLRSAFQEIVDAALCMTVIPACESIENPADFDRVRNIFGEYENCSSELDRMSPL